MRAPDASYKGTWIWRGEQHYVTTGQVSLFIRSGSVSVTPVQGAFRVRAGVAGWRVVAPGLDDVVISAQATIVLRTGVRIPMDPQEIPQELLTDPRWTDMFEFEARVPAELGLPREVVFTIKSRGWAAEGQWVSFLPAWYRVNLRAE